MPCSDSCLKRNSNVIIFSHGNSTDIYRMHRSLIEMAEKLNVNILSYDYRGYGHSDGQPTDENIIEDIKSVYNFAIKSLNYKWDNIILYGQSVGRGPTIYLAARIEYPIGGLILHSPLASGLKLIDGSLKRVLKNDFFPNFQVIKYVNAPVFIIHGQQDDVIPFSHGKELYDNTQNQYPPLWLQQANHNNILELYGPDFYYEVKRFLISLSEEQNQIGKENLIKAWGAQVWPTAFNHIYNQSRFTGFKQDDKDVEKKYFKLSTLSRSGTSLSSKEQRQENLSFQIQVQLQNIQLRSRELITNKNVMIELESKKKSFSYSYLFSLLSNFQPKCNFMMVTKWTYTNET